jgi:predicted MFS family arabinose efflux permease
VNLGSDDRTRLRRGRVATSLLFLLFGAALGTWTARIPAVKDHLHLSDGRLSLALLAFAAGCIVGMAAIGRLTDRFGSTRVMIPMALCEGVLLVPPAFMPNLLGLGLALFVFGLVHGTLNIAMNANAIEVQRAWGGPIMSSFHAVYSIGGFLGAIVGGLFARGDISVGTTFLSVGGVVFALALWASWWALPAPPVTAAPVTPASQTPASQTPAPAGRALPEPRSYALLFLGVLALCALVGEGAAADWSAVYLHDSLGTTAAFATYAYAAFAIMMTVGRLLGDRLAARFGPVNLVRASGVLAAVGLGAALLVGRPVAGVIGFACLGAGMSGIAPQVYSAAGNRDPARAGRALSLVVSIGYVGFVLGPILIGSASTVVGLAKALAIPAFLALFVAASAAALRPASPAAVAPASPALAADGDRAGAGDGDGDGDGAGDGSEPHHAQPEPESRSRRDSPV